MLDEQKDVGTVKADEAAIEHLDRAIAALEEAANIVRDCAKMSEGGGASVRKMLEESLNARLAQLRGNRETYARLVALESTPAVPRPPRRR